MSEDELINLLCLVALGMIVLIVLDMIWCRFNYCRRCYEARLTRYDKRSHPGLCEECWWETQKNRTP